MSHLPGPAWGQPPAGPEPELPRRLFLPDVARLARVDYSTARAYHNRSMQRRRAERLGRPWRHLSGDDLPPPDGREPGRRGRPWPYWHPGTLAPWLETRQGPGRPRAGGGPPVPRNPRRARPGPKPRYRRKPARRAVTEEGTPRARTDPRRRKR